MKTIIRVALLGFFIIAAAIFFFIHWQQKKPQPDRSAVTKPLTILGLIAYEYQGGIWISELGKDNPVCLTPRGFYPRWAPDGRQVAFRRDNQILHIHRDGQYEEILAHGEKLRAVAYHPNGQEILFTDGDEIKAVSLKDKKITTILTGYNSAELDISASGSQLICTVTRPIRIIAVDLPSGQKRTLARECSASLSPDGKLVTSLNGRHTKLHLRSWKTGEIVSIIDPPADFLFDNQFWSNHPDWIASQAELKNKEAGNIYIHQVSQNHPFQVTSTSGCSRPDLFVDF